MGKKLVVRKIPSNKPTSNAPVIRLKSKRKRSRKKKWYDPTRTIEEGGKFSESILASVLTSPRTTAVLGGTLGGLLGGLPGAVKGFLLGGTVAGVVSVSPKARTFLKEKIIRPEKTGQQIGGFIEDPKGNIEGFFSRTTESAKGFIEEKKGILKTAGAVLAGAGLGAGILSLGKILGKGKEKVKDLTGDLQLGGLASPSLPSGKVDTQKITAVERQDIISHPPKEEAEKPLKAPESKKNGAGIVNIIQNQMVCPK